jgi:N-acetyl-gamma-glutamyl-phosphate reductase common form
MNKKIATFIIGGSGYVSGEMIRLALGHPHLELKGVVSSTKQDQSIDSAFPHLAPVLKNLTFIDIDSLMLSLPSHNKLLVLAAAPHGKSAEIIKKIYDETQRLNIDLSVIDTSADFRFNDPKAYQSIYGIEHCAPELLDKFLCSIPEIEPSKTSNMIAHPGCFSTSMLLSLAPLISDKYNIENAYISSVTGSSGSGALPQQSTHHPIRLNNHYAYSPMTHRHQPEVEHILKQSKGKSINIDFVPQSGSFVRGIHTTAFIRLDQAIKQDELQSIFLDYYADAPFVRVINHPPKIKDVSGTNYTELYATVVINVSIDNLIKGAAGGAIQWANRIYNFDQMDGLSQPSIGWY